MPGDAPARGPEGAGRFHVLARRDGQHLAAHEAARRSTCAKRRLAGLLVASPILNPVVELGPERALAESTAYLDAFGTIAVAWRWLAQARVAAAAAADDFSAGKLAACRYFFRYELSCSVAALDRLATLDDLIFTVRPEML